MRMIKNGGRFYTFTAKTDETHSFEFPTAHNIYARRMISRAYVEKCCHPLAVHGLRSAKLTHILLITAISHVFVSVQQALAYDCMVSH